MTTDISTDYAYRVMKKQRTNGGEGYSTSQSMDSIDRKHKVPPSPVIHIRGLLEYVSELEIRDALQTFGNISYCMTFPNKQMALVEFEDIEAAKEVVNFASTKALFINGKQAMFNFSTSQQITRPTKEQSEGEPNNVLLLTVDNVQHPITVDVLYAVCSPVGTVFRIVIFRRNGVQAMVEFDSIETAAKARSVLHRADIYLNCCTIKAEFAKPKTLTVRRNDLDTWDFTVASNFGHDIAVMKTQPLLADPKLSTMPVPYTDMYGSVATTQRPMPGISEPLLAQGRGAGTAGDGRWTEGQGYDNQMMMAGYDMMAASRGLGRGTMYNPMTGVGQSMGGGVECQDNCVLMVYGLVTERMTCTKLFNLLCLYGNVIRIKFLKSKDGSAMVQMGDREGCERVCRLLSEAKLYGNKLQISFSKQPYLQAVQSPFNMFDGSPSFMDFQTNRNNRYTTPGAAAKIRITSPTNILYFYNAPHSLDESTLIQTFLDAGTAVPTKTAMLPAKSEKSSRGCVYFEDVEGASEALMVVNNSKMKNPSAPGGAPYVLKLTFSHAPPTA